jgi:RHS repeat-associated protein
MQMRTFENQACPLQDPQVPSPCTSSYYTLHFDGSTLLFVTDGNGNLVQFDVESLAASQCASGQPATACISSSLVIDRDFSGSAVDWHNGAGTAGTTVTPEYAYDRTYAGFTTIGHISGKYPANGTAIALPTGNFIGTSRTDGFQAGWLTFQGVRAYSGVLGTWTTPDQYQGTVDNTLSQRAYAWEGNNPLAFVDPSGFDFLSGDTCPSGWEYNDHMVWNPQDGESIDCIASGDTTIPGDGGAFGGGAGPHGSIPLGPVHCIAEQNGSLCIDSNGKWQFVDVMFGSPNWCGMTQGGRDVAESVGLTTFGYGATYQVLSKEGFAHGAKVGLGLSGEALEWVPSALINSFTFGKGYVNGWKGTTASGGCK